METTIVHWGIYWGSIGVISGMWARVKTYGHNLIGCFFLVIGRLNYKAYLSQTGTFASNLTWLCRRSLDPNY